jgi:hypothetical protein
VTVDEGAAAGTPARRQGMREGWYPCPSGQPQLRYWSGSEWTDRTRPDLVSWVHGDRVLDVPGVFAFGRSADEAPGARPGPLEPHVWRRARLALILLVPIYLASLLPLGLALSYVGLPAVAFFTVLIDAAALGAYGPSRSSRRRCRSRGRTCGPICGRRGSWTRRGGWTRRSRPVS